MKQTFLLISAFYLLTPFATQASEETRAGKTFTALFQPVGIAPGANASLAGLEAGFFLSPNDILTLQRRHLVNYFGGSDYGSTFSAFSYGLHLKHFAGQSFYVTTGVDLYEFSEGSGRISSSEPRTYIDGRVIAAEFAIGNQWHWGGFTLGCDWVGLVYPISKTITREVSYRSSTFLNGVNLELLRFYLGVAF